MKSQIASFVFLLGTHGMALSQDAGTFPSGPVKLIVATSAGAGMDAVARLIGEKLSGTWGKPVVVENRPGGAGAVALNAFKASKDPNTLLVGDMGLAAINPTLYPRLGYNPQVDLKPVTDLFYTSFYFVTRPDKYPTFQQVLAAAKAAPGKLNYGSTGAGTGQRLSMELLKQAAGIGITYIPFKGNTEAVSALVGGEVDVVSVGLPAVKAFLDSGRLKAVATSSAKRSPSQPGVPTVAESIGLKSFEAQTWVGLFTAPNTPQSVISKIQTDVAKVMQREDVKSFYFTNDYSAGGNTPEAFSVMVASDMKKYAELIKAVGIKVE